MTDAPMPDTARLRELDDALRAYDRDLLASYDVHPEAYENDTEAGENRRALLDQLLRLAHPALLDAIDAAEAARDKAEAERDENAAHVVEFSETAAALVEEMSKRPQTTWGQVKAAIRALGDLGDRRAYGTLKARAERAEAQVARLTEALRMSQFERMKADGTSNNNDDGGLGSAAHRVYGD